MAQFGIQSLVPRGNIVPSTEGMMVILRDLTAQEYIEENALPAAVAGVCAYFLADTFIAPLTLDQLGDKVEMLVGGTGTVVLQQVMGDNFFGDLTSIGLPALSGIGNQFSSRLTADVSDPTKPSADALNYVKWLFAILVALAVYVGARNNKK